MYCAERVSVVVAHADPIVQLGLIAALAHHQDIAILTSTDAVEEARPDVEPSSDSLHGGKPRVIVTDYDHGMALLARRPADTAPRRGASDRILILTHRSREGDVTAALLAGTSGYLLFGCSADELAAGVRSLHRGTRYLCNHVAQSIANSLTREKLTVREVEVLDLLIRGFSNKGIANELGVAVGTVKAHVKGIFQKLEARTRTQAAAVAAERGLFHEPSRPDAISGIPFPFATDHSTLRRTAR